MLYAHSTEDKLQLEIVGRDIMKKRITASCGNIPPP